MIEAALARHAPTREAVKICPVCKTNFPPSLTFCERDGTALMALETGANEPPISDEVAKPAIATIEHVAIPPAIAATGAQFCENCGSRIMVGDSFCSDCGTKVEVLGAPAAAPAITPALSLGETLTEPAMGGQKAMPPKSEAASVSALSEAERVAGPLSVQSAQDEQPAEPAQDESYADDFETLPYLPPSPPETTGDVPETQAEDRDVEAAPKGNAALVWAVGALALIGAVGGSGYVWREQMVDLFGGGAEDTATGRLATVQDGIPRVAGKYTAFLMDQEIEIAFEGDPAVLAQAKGTARYLNTVNGGRCVSRLVAIESGGIGGDTSGKVLFSQQPKDGEPSCGQDIPMLIDLDKRAIAEDGLISRLSVEWKSPESNQVLMSGNLVLSKSVK
jgi:cytochrome c5